MAKKKQRQGSRSRIPWAVRMGIWSVLLVAVVIAGLVFLLRMNGDDGGTSRFASIHRFDTADYHSLAISPTSPGTVLYGHHNGLQKSDDGGRTWKVIVDQSGWDAMNLVFDPFSPETVYMAGHNVYYRSEDGGRTWNEVASDLPGLDLHAFAASPNEQGRLYAFAVGYGLHASDDGGRQWRLLSGDVPQGTAAIFELPDGTLLLAAADAGILRSEDGGKSWAESRQGIDTGVIFTVKGDPKGQRLYVGTNRGLFASVDGGRTWSATSLDDTLALVVGVNPSEPLEVLVVDGDGNLFRSEDGGQTWGSS